MTFLLEIHKFINKKTSLKTSLVQLVERRFPKPNAVGSSPTGRVSISFVYVQKRIFARVRNLTYFTKSRCIKKIQKTASFLEKI